MVVAVGVDVEFADEAVVGVEELEVEAGLDDGDAGAGPAGADSDAPLAEAEVAGR